MERGREKEREWRERGREREREDNPKYLVLQKWDWLTTYPILCYVLISRFIRSSEPINCTVPLLTTLPLTSLGTTPTSLQNTSG